jgi:DNA-binding NarL/FixJ family response regulator
MPEHRVLIIEDRPEIAERLQHAIDTTEGITLVGTAGTLDQGLQMLFDLRPRIILVDLGLPDGSGVEAVEAVAKADWQVDALVISIFGDEARVVQALRAGAKGYLLKGGDLSGVGADIHTVIEGGSPISPAIARHVLNLLSIALPDTSSQPHMTLTEREVEILRAVARGYKRAEIGGQLGISAGTVGNHITSIYRKLEVRSNIEAVAHATRMGVL